LAHNPFNAAANFMRCAIATIHKHWP